MKKRKLNQNRTIIILILIFSIILIFTYKIAKETKTQGQDDILFFKLWSNGEKQNQIQNSNSENLNKKLPPWSRHNGSFCTRDYSAAGASSTGASACLLERLIFFWALPCFCFSSNLTVCCSGA